MTYISRKHYLINFTILIRVFMRNALLILPATALLFSGCGPQTIISNWNDDNITIDGRQDDWLDKLDYLEDEKVSAGAFNDDEYIYLCLTSNDITNIQQILDPGITIMFISDRPGVRPRGIRYPLPSRDIGLKSTMDLRMESYQQDYLKNFVRDIQENQKEFQIINDDNYTLYTYPLNNGSGIKIKLGENMDELVYETAVPIADNENAEFRLEVYPGDEIRIEISSNEIIYPEKSSQVLTGTGGRTGVPGVEIYSRPVPMNFIIDVTLVETP